MGGGVRVLLRGFVVAGLVFPAGQGLGQIRLPGGITINDPRMPNRTNVPGQRPGQPSRPDPDKVCPTMIAWLQVLRNEYPGVDLAHTMANKVQQMAVPLFADDPFQKQFGVSYPSMSDADRRQFFSTHIPPCQTSREYAQQTVVLQVFNPPFQPGTAGVGPLSPGQLIPALSRLSAARAALQGDERVLQTTQPSADAYDQAVGLAGKRKDELARVWPSEKTQFQAAVKDAVSRSATVAVQAKIQPLLTAPASPEVARQLQEAPRTYATLLQAVPGEQRTTLETQLDQRRSQVLREMLPPQQAKADAFPPTRDGLDQGAEWYAAYRQVFLQAPVLPEADALGKSYVQRREAVLAKLAPQFRHAVETSEDAQAVASMDDEVFRLPEDRDTDVYRQLSAARSARADLLAKRAEQAQRAAEEKAERAALARGEIVASSLKTANLANAAVYRALYTGDFAHAGVQRANVLFEDMFDDYLQQFGTSCKEALPADKVQMSEPECKRELERTVYGRYGVVSQSTECVEWGRRMLDMDADPRAFEAKVALEDVAPRNAFRGFLQVLATSGSDPVSGMMGQASDLLQQEMSLKQDTPRLITENGCNSKALARLQENMKRFASGDDPVHLAGFVPDTTRMTRAQDLNARALADDLIRANAAGWLMNRYTGLDGVQVDGAVDAQGRARHLHATYDQKGVMSTGSVDIAFVDGVPACLYFADDPGNCKAPSPSVVKRFEDGAYRAKGGR